VQEKLVKAGAAVIPVNSAAAGAISNPTIKQVLRYSQSASYVQTYFDIALPTAPGQALDDAAANLFAGQGGADSVAKAVNSGG
jgi:raffinose/stachyose/melibiose transport system substrate-binding protein